MDATERGRGLRDGVLGHSGVRFLLVGCSNAVLSYLTFRLLLWLLPPSPVGMAASQFVGYGVGVAWSYVWNRRFTFRNRSAWRAQALRFVILQGALALGSSLALGAVAGGRAQDPTLPWLAVMGVVTVVNYALCRWWVFR